VYDPSQYNDRLLLGFKGTMSEAELHWLRNRLLGGKLEKASKGELRLPLPTGLVYDAAEEVMLEPDQEVQQALRLVFELFQQLGTASAVDRYFRQHSLLIPTRQGGGKPDGQLSWHPLSTGRVLAILHNPAYAGAYAYGRSESVTQVLPEQDQPIKKRIRRLDPDEWTFLLLDTHPGYITWDQYLHNRQKIDDNCTARNQDRRGAVREGTALLQGIVLCGRCGRRMSINYLQDGLTPVYKCYQAYRQFGQPTCQNIRGDALDAAVAQLFLEAMQPAQLEISLAALEQIETRTQQLDQQWQLRLERVRYQADLARRRLFAVEPENRLVARNLEKDWNEKLAEIERLEREYLTWSTPKTFQLGPEQRQRILALAQDLPAVWQATTTSCAERKQLLRCLIKDVTLTRRQDTIHLGVRWQTEALSELDVPCPKRIYDIQRTSPAVIDQIRQLALTHPDPQIATHLNQAGLTTGTGRPFTADRVRWIRKRYSIPTACPEAPAACPSGQRGDGRYSTQTAATLLNVCDSTILRWCEAGRLDSLQAVPNGPRWIRLTPELIAQLRKPSRRHLADRSSK
jgi:hypothetical protein